MVEWDLVMDPTGSTLTRAWVWYDSGGYFGVPLTNFFGWFLVTFTYFLLFSLVVYARRERPAYRDRPALFWSIPILLYMAAGLSHLPPLADQDSLLLDAGHRVWAANDLRETAVIQMLFTMRPTSLLALLRLAHSAPRI